jgi:hypothetical protein
LIERLVEFFLFIGEVNSILLIVLLVGRYARNLGEESKDFWIEYGLFILRKEGPSFTQVSIPFTSAFRAALGRN